MFSCRFHLFCLVSILYISLCAGSSSNVKKCVETERQALLKFKASLIDEKGILSSWQGEDCCQWEGITCDNSTGHVTMLDLQHYSTAALGGKIDSSLCELQHLTSLDLSANYLQGKIPKCIGSLSKLIELKLAANELVSAIPQTLGNLSNLQTLDLSDNKLEGHIPKSFERMCQLKTLYLSNNKLSGNLNDSIQYLCSTHNGIEDLDISHNPFNGPFPDVSKLTSWKILNLRNTSIHGSLPQSLGHFPYLVTLDLSFNQLSGSLPSFGHFPYLVTVYLDDNQLNGSLSFFEVTELVSLEYLDLSNNQLKGTLPYNIGKLSNLSFLSVYSNKLNGVIHEEHLSNLSKLETLDLEGNSLSFNLSSDWVPRFQLIDLFASSCILGPNFPSWLKHQGSLEGLEMSKCGISDSFPKWFWDLSSGLLYLNVSHNNLSGSFPKSIPNFTFVDIAAKWDLSFNNLVGPLPHFPPSLGLLSVSNNMFSGSMSSFCSTSFPNLTRLDLSSNFLDGRLLDCWGQLKNLQILNLAKNNFSGRIPKSLGTLQQIETIHLNNNNFSGKIPTLTRYSKLKFIDFGDNNLEGLLPAWLGQNLQKLIVLRLRANKFHGSLPTSLCDLLHLQVLDLSQNNITGRIPQCLDHIIALTNIKFHREPISYISGLISVGPENIGLFGDNTILTWKGENREYGKNVGFLTAIDLSCNQLTGEIPDSITILIALASLNLSGNNLTGFIPNNIGHMKMLESLDLSRNYLYGRIPEGISNLSFLNYLNLSINNLSGKIPISTQLDTFKVSSYLGNSRLCGPPLSNECLEDGNTRRNGTEGDNDDDELISFGFYISLGLGFIIGFWGVCGTLVLNASWRNVYFRFFNNIYDWIYVQVVVITIRMKRRPQVQD